MGRNWLAEERDAARRRAEGDETAKIRLAVAWTRIYDVADELAQRLEEHVCGDEACRCHAVLRDWYGLHRHSAHRGGGGSTT